MEYRDHHITIQFINAHRHRRDFLVLTEAARTIEQCVRHQNTAIRFDAEQAAIDYFDRLEGGDHECFI